MKRTKKNITRVLKILSRFKKKIAIILLANLFVSICGIIDSFLLSYLIDKVVFSSERKALLTVTLILFLVSIVNILLTSIKNTHTAQLSYKLDYELMTQYFEKVMNMNYSDIEKYRVGDLLSRVNDVRNVRNALSEGIISIIGNLFSFFAVGLSLYMISDVLFFIIFLSVIIHSILVLYFGSYFAFVYPQSMRKFSDLQSFLNESFSGIETVKTNPAISMFKRLNIIKEKDYIESNWQIDEKSIQQKGLNSLIEKITTIIVLFTGCLLVMKGSMSLGQIVSFLSLSLFFNDSVLNLLNLQSGIQGAVSSLDRMYEIIDEKCEIDKGTYVSLTDVSSITFKNVDFFYEPNHIIYKNLNIEIKKGEWVSIVGKTGCGKSTLAKLLLRLYKPTSGDIFLNGININRIQLSNLREVIGYVPQNLHLFTGSLIENIAMFNPSVQKDRICLLSQNVGLLEKDSELSDAFSSIVGENGITMSGGEKQKVVICRSLLKQPLICILDEATSNLDRKSESEIIQIIRHLKKQGVIVISIAHRLSTVKNCDKIFVIGEGRVLEEGSYSELIERNKAFCHLFEK